MDGWMDVLMNGCMGGWIDVCIVCVWCSRSEE